jgi:hypothetical protein
LVLVVRPSQSQWSWISPLPNCEDKAVPEPSDPMCLSALAFVFAGELESFSSNEAIDLVKCFGGYVIQSIPPFRPLSNLNYLLQPRNTPNFL